MKKLARKLTLSRSALISSMLLGALLAGQTVSAQVLEKGRGTGARTTGGASSPPYLSSWMGSGTQRVHCRPPNSAAPSW